MKPFPTNMQFMQVKLGNGGLSSGGISFLLWVLPAEFGGPVDRWSLLVFAVADRFVLTFRAPLEPPSLLGEISSAVHAVHWSGLIKQRGLPRTVYLLRLRFSTEENVERVKPLQHKAESGC